MNTEPDLPFKGGRDYLHSTTLFDHILGLREPSASVDFAFNRKTDRQVSLRSKPPVGDALPVASWKDDAGTLYVIEREAAITERRPYDEDGLAASFAYAADPASVSIPADIGEHSRFEAVVAGFKAMLQRHVVPAATRLAFARIRLQRPLEGPLTIRYGRRMGHFHQGSIDADTGKVGQIFFGEWQ